VARTRTQRNLAFGSAEALQLYGVLAHDGTAVSPIPGSAVVTLRELAAVVRQVPYERLDATTEAIEDYRRVVESAFRDHAVLPAPFGTVFKWRESLLHWMEIHYVALVDAIGFVHDRAMARVRVERAKLPPEALTETREARVQDFESTVFDSFRFLKRNAIACVTFPPQGTPPNSKSAEASFLVEREKWGVFADAVEEEQRRLPEFAIEQTGPWPPYDFVRLQFGG
jgi:hypothetical protein